MIDSVKAVTANPLREPFIRARINCCGIRQSAVKTSVEDGNLENSAKSFLDDVDPLQLGEIMEWRKGGPARNGRFNFWSDGGRLVEVLSPVHDTVAYYVSPC